MAKTVVHKVVRRQPRSMPREEERVWAAALIGRSTGALREGGGLRVDWKLLTVPEAHELVGLLDRCGNGSFIDDRGLSKGDRARLVELVERACDAEGVFERHRNDQAAWAEFERLRREQQPRMTVSAGHEQGLLAAIAQQVYDRALWPEHVALLVYLLGCMTRGECLGWGAAVLDEDGDPVVRFERMNGPWGRAAGPNTFWNTGLRQLKHLEANRWFTLAQVGGTVEVRLGSRARRAFTRGLTGDRPRRRTKEAA